MTSRQREIMRAALIYFQANLDDAQLAFAAVDPDSGETLDEVYEVNGEQIDPITEVEVESCLWLVQG